MVAGHLIMPYRPGASWVKPAAFYALLFATGAFRGDRDAACRGVSRGRHRTAQNVIWGAAVIVLGVVASSIMHNKPF